MRLENRIIAWIAVGLMAGCSGESGTESFSEVRTVSPPEVGLADSTVTNPHAGGAMPLQPATGTSLTWTTPDGWSERAASSMRIANLGIDGEPDVECYVTKLSGAAGGLEANINRWRTQLSLAPLSPEDIVALPTMTILGGDAVLVEMEGSYKGMGGTDGQDGFALFGAVAQSGGASYFIKMTGPADVLQRERENFTSFCASLNHNGGMAIASSSSSAPDPHAGLTNVDSATTSPFSWTAPNGWAQSPNRPMRVVTFTVNGAECYVTTLRGRAGGAAANINRWRTQMAQPELAPADLAALGTISVLGQASQFVEVAGTYAGMDGTQTDDALLLGIVREGDAESIFIKMIGPKTAVEAERENFIAFCESLT